MNRSPSSSAGISTSVSLSILQSSAVSLLTTCICLLFCCLYCLGSKKAKKETKRVKKEKDPNAPKRPQTAFFHFMGDNRERVKRDNPDIKHTDIARVLGEEWKSIAANAKAVSFSCILSFWIEQELTLICFLFFLCLFVQKYEALAKKDKERYERDMASYQKKGGEKKKGKKEESESDEDGSDEE